MLDILQTRQNIKKEVILANLYENNEDIADSKCFIIYFIEIFILEKIFDLELQKEVDQIILKEEPLAFVQREKYEHDIEEPILDFISDFIEKEVLEEDKIKSGKQKDHSQNLEVPPVILFIDNVYMMDKPSWELLAELKKSCKRI